MRENVILSKEEIVRFFEEEIGSRQNFFLYKDNSLLKEGDFAGFAKHRLKEVQKSAYIYALSFAFFLLGSVGYLLQYLAGTGWAVIQLGASLFFGLFALAVLIYSVKEYYSVKVSMNLLLKILGEEKTTEPDGVHVLENQ